MAWYESAEMFNHALSAVATKLQRRQLPVVAQFHSDWLPEAAKAADRKVLHVTDLEHMVANLSKRRPKTCWTIRRLWCHGIWEFPKIGDPSIVP